MPLPLSKQCTRCEASLNALLAKRLTVKGGRLCRLQDVLPLAVFMEAHKRDGELKSKMA